MITLQAEVDQSFVELVARVKQFSMGAAIDKLFPSAVQAARIHAYSIASQWKRYASGQEQLPSGDTVKRPDDGYVSSIQVREDGPFEYYIFSNHPKAGFYERGMAPFDMKETHPYGPKSRVAKKKIPKRFGGGFRYVPYLVVPFRWATPGSGAHMGAKNVIPEKIYSRILSGMKKGAFKRTVTLSGTKLEENFFGEMVERAMYASEGGGAGWGSQIDGEEFRKLEGLKRSTISRVPLVSGLSAMNAKGQTNYMTFRVISADSPFYSWQHPGVKARRIAEQTARFMQGKDAEAINNGLMNDLKGHGML